MPRLQRSARRVDAGPPGRLRVPRHDLRPAHGVGAARPGRGIVSRMSERRANEREVYYFGSLLVERGIIPRADRTSGVRRLRYYRVWRRARQSRRDSWWLSARTRPVGAPVESTPRGQNRALDGGHVQRPSQTVPPDDQLTNRGQSAERPLSEFGETEAAGVTIRPTSASLESVTSVAAQQSSRGREGASGRIVSLLATSNTI